VVVVISRRLSIEYIIKSFDNASKAFLLPKGKVSLHYEHLETPLP
jgi:hypothetical protein